MKRLKLTSCELDMESGWIWRDGARTDTRLNDVLFRLLQHLCEHAGEDVSHDVLRQQVWGDRLERETPADRKQKMRKVYIAVTRLRRLLGDDGRPYRHIVSSRVGSYRFRPLSTRRAQAAGPAPSARSRPTP